MAETFYSVLGVDQDADAARIKEAYREKVKTHHPDVSDESDAAEQFQRITEARDVLVDDTARKRYDRLGHAAYVSRHIDSNVWSSAPTEGQRTRRNGQSGGGDQSDRERTDRSSDGSRRSTGGSTASNRDAGGSSGAGSGSSERRRNRSSDRRQHRSRSTANSAQSSASRGGERAAWMGESGWSTASSASASGNASRTRRTRTDGWRKQHAASNVYSPTGRDTGIGNEAAQSQFAKLARGIGPWIVFHFVFLISAFVTIYLLMSWSPTIPTMFGSLLLLGCAIFFSILHMVTRIYS